MVERRLVLALAALALLAATAGCAGDSSADPAEDNPWNSNPVSVDVRAGPELEELTREALDYWETEGTSYHDHNVTFEITDDEDADIVVKSGTGPCGPMQAGCYTEFCFDGECDHTVAVDWHEDDSWRLQVLKHEFGHALGLNHSSDPEFMEAYIEKSEP